jgi:hypothetical protein
LGGLYISLPRRRQLKNDVLDFGSEGDAQSERHSVESTGENDVLGLRRALSEQAAKQ